MSPLNPWPWVLAWSCVTLLNGNSVVEMSWGQVRRGEAEVAAGLSERQQLCLPFLTMPWCVVVATRARGV